MCCAFKDKPRIFKQFYNVGSQIGSVIGFVEKLWEQFQQPVIIRLIASLQ